MKRIRFVLATIGLAVTVTSCRSFWSGEGEAEPEEGVTLEMPETPCDAIEIGVETPGPALRVFPYPSPNCNARRRKVDTIVLHYTAIASLDKSLRVLTDARSRDPVSAHYVVGADGAVFRLVEEDRRAWHAGGGSWRGLEDMNSASIGIEIVNAGFSADGARPPYPSVQIDAVIALCKDIMSRHSIRWVIGHSDLAPTRKLDPGEHFPWKRLAQAGVGFWTDDFAAPYGSARQMLIDLGYNPVDLPQTLAAFSRHWYPEALTAGATNVLGRLSAVAQAMR